MKAVAQNKSQNVQIEEQILSIMSLVPTDSVQQRLLLTVQVYAQGLLRPVGGEAAGGAGRHQARPRLVRQAASSQPLAARGLRPRQRGVRLQLRRRPAEEGSELGGAEVPSLHLW